MFIGFILCLQPPPSRGLLLFYDVTMSKNKKSWSFSRIQKRTASRLTLAPYKQLIILLSLLKDTNTSQTAQLFSYVEQHKIQNILCS